MFLAFRRLILTYLCLHCVIVLLSGVSYNDDDDDNGANKPGGEFSTKQISQGRNIKGEKVRYFV